MSDRSIKNFAPLKNDLEITFYWQTLRKVFQMISSCHKIEMVFPMIDEPGEETLAEKSGALGIDSPLRKRKPNECPDVNLDKNRIVFFKLINPKLNDMIVTSCIFKYARYVPAQDESRLKPANKKSSQLPQKINYPTVNRTLAEVVSKEKTVSHLPPKPTKPVQLESTRVEDRSKTFNAYKPDISDIAEASHEGEKGERTELEDPEAVTTEEIMQLSKSRVEIQRVTSTQKSKSQKDPNASTVFKRPSVASPILKLGEKRSVRISEEMSSPKPQKVVEKPSVPPSKLHKEPSTSSKIASHNKSRDNDNFFGISAINLNKTSHEKVSHDKNSRDKTESSDFMLSDVDLEVTLTKPKNNLSRVPDSTKSSATVTPPAKLPDWFLSLPNPNQRQFSSGFKFFEPEKFRSNFLPHDFEMTHDFTKLSRQNFVPFLINTGKKIEQNSCLFDAKRNYLRVKKELFESEKLRLDYTRKFSEKSDLII